MTGDDLEAADYRYGDTIANHVTVRFQPRALGAVGAVIWSAVNVPIRLNPRETKTIIARYRDPDQAASLVGAIHVLLPQKNIDYVVNSLEDGSGQNTPNAIAISVIIKASAAEITLINLRAVARHVTRLQLRGTPLLSYDVQLAEATSAESIRDDGFQHRLVDVPSMSSADDAAHYASYYLTRFKDRVGRFASVSFTANKTDTRMTHALTAAIGSRISVNDSLSQHSADYIIVGERHTLTPGGEHTHIVTWILKSATRDTFWVLGRVGHSELGTTTKLAF